MDDILYRIEQNLMRLGVKKGARVIAAVSGGPDSMALLHALNALSGDIGFRLEAAHYNHNLRGSSLRDENIARDYCAGLNIKLHTQSGDIRAMAAGGNIERVARDARYSFMLGLLDGEDNGWLAVAHHQSDLAESVLLNVLRGAGTRGLSGMPMGRGRIIRPMLNIPKADIDSYVKQYDIPYGIDETNMSVEYTRNSIRLELLPYLQQRYTPQIVSTLERLATNAAEDEDYISGRARAVIDSLDVTSVGDFFRAFDGDVISKQHPAVGKRAVRMLLESMGIYDIDQNAMNNAFAALGQGNRVDLGGGVFIKGGRRAELYRLQKCDDVLRMDGAGLFTSEHWRFKVEVVPMPVQFTCAGDWTQYINIGYIDKIPLIARIRRQGERMRPINAGGKKLGDIMTDKKVPLALRDALPVVEQGGQVLWAVGAALADAAKVDGEDSAIKIHFEWNNEMGEMV